jgi:hypothetical protein
MVLSLLFVSSLMMPLPLELLRFALPLPFVGTHDTGMRIP